MTVALFLLGLAIFLAGLVAGLVAGVLLSSWAEEVDGIGEAQP